MEKSEIEKYITQLKELNSIIDNDSDNVDQLDFMRDLNQVLSQLSGDILGETTIKSQNIVPKPILKYINLSNNPDPEFIHEGDSGFDFRAFINTELVTIPPGRVSIIPTGIYVEIEKGLELQVRSRSGFAANEEVFVLNSPGTVDCVTEDTYISTPSGDILVKSIFENTIKEVISFNEETFKSEIDYIDDMWIVNDIDCIKVITDNNSVIIPLTKEVYTKRGWIKGKDLNSDDEILVIE